MMKIKSLKIVTVATFTESECEHCGAGKSYPAVTMMASGTGVVLPAMFCSSCGLIETGMLGRQK